MMRTILPGSRTSALVLASRHWPAVSNTVSPSGKRGLTSRARNSRHCASLTPSLPPILRPNRSSTSIICDWGAEQESCAAAAVTWQAQNTAAANLRTTMAKPCAGNPADDATYQSMFRMAEAHMAVQLNHTILYARDSRASATFLADILGLPAPTHWGPFEVVATANGANLDYLDTADEIASQ